MAKDFLKPSVLKLPVIEEIGIVQSTEGNRAKVAVPKKSGCEGCTHGTCKSEGQSMIIDAVNAAGAAVGQKVKVRMSAFTYSRGSVLAFGIPAAALFLGAVFGKEVLGPRLQGFDADVLSAITGFGALIAAFLIVKFVSARADKGKESVPVIDEILN